VLICLSLIVSMSRFRAVFVTTHLTPPPNTAQINYSASIRNTGGYTSVASDGVFLYVYLKDGGLVKLGSGQRGTLSGYVYASQPYYRYVVCCLCCATVLCCCVVHSEAAWRNETVLFYPFDGVCNAAVRTCRVGERGTLAYACGKLYYRSPAVAPAACVIIDPVTLNEVGAVQVRRWSHDGVVCVVWRIVRVLIM